MMMSVPNHVAKAPKPEAHEARRAPLVIWGSDLSVHSPTLDLHHQILIGCLNRMIGLQRIWRDSLPAIRRELALIMNYCKIHFFIEESAMTRAKIRDDIHDHHRATHRKILGKMAEAVKAFHDNPMEFPFDDTLKFLNVWLAQHIRDEDRTDYAEALLRQPNIEADLSKYRYSEISRKLKLREELANHQGAMSLTGRLISVVDGNMKRRGHLIDTLQGEGVNVSQAETVSEAQQLIDSSVPELLFLDWSLPAALPFARFLYRARNTAVIACHVGDPRDIINVCDVEGVANILTYPCGTRDIITATHETLDVFVPLRALVLERVADTNRR